MKTFQDLSFTDYFKIIRRRIWWVIVPAFLISVSSAIYLRRLPSMYKSETTIMGSSRLVPEDYIAPLVRESVTDRIDFVRQQLRSRTFVEGMIQEFQLAKTWTGNMEDLINNFQMNLEIGTVSPGTFKVAYTATSPARAQAITRRLAERVLTLNDTVRKDKVYAADHFLDEEVRRAAGELSVAENKVRQFNRLHFPGIPDEQIVSLGTVDGLERQLVAMTSDLENKVSQRRFLARRLDEQRQLTALLQNPSGPSRSAQQSPQPQDNQYAQTDLEKALAAKQAELSAAVSRYTPLHPDVARLSRQVRELQDQVAAQARPSKPPNSRADASGPVVPAAADRSDDLMQAEIQLELEQMDRQIAKQEQAKNDLVAKISLYRGRLNLPAALDQQLSALTREVDSAKQRLNLLTSKKLSSDMAGSVDTSANNALFRILDPANLPNSPISPDRPKLLAVGCLLGLGLGLGIAFLREFADSTLADEDEVSSRLKLPVLASIPIVPSSQPEKRRTSSGRKLSLIASPIETYERASFSLHAADSKVKQVIFGPVSIAGEQYRVVHASLALKRKQHGLKSILIASTIPNEGKSFVAACLAGVLAREAGNSVLLIHADMRTSKGWQMLGIHHGDSFPIGLSEVLQGSANVKDAILKSTEFNLYVLPAGKIVSNPTELLCTPQFENLLHDVGPSFHWIIIDSPPILALADARLLVPLCDAALLVVRADKTPANLVKDCIERVGKDHICGVLLNGARNIKSSHYYEPYYHRSSQ